MYIYIYMMSSFPIRDKQHSKILACNANPKFIDCVLENNCSHMKNMCIYEKLFSKTRQVPFHKMSLQC